MLFASANTLAQGHSHQAYGRVCVQQTNAVQCTPNLFQLCAGQLQVFFTPQKHAQKSSKLMQETTVCDCHHSRECDCTQGQYACG